MTNQEFITFIAPSAVEFFKAYKISAAFIIAQGCLESAYGTAAPGNNLFGIKADSSWAGPIVRVPTKEYINGQEVTVQATFRAYKTMGDSITDHGNFLLTNSNYHNLIGADYRASCRLIASVDGYATDQTYGAQLLEIIAQFGLAKYDVVSYPTYNVLVNQQVYKAIAVNSATYVLWTALREFNTPYSYKGNGRMTVSGKDVQGVVCEGDTYLPWACLADGIKSMKIEWVFSK